MITSLRKIQEEYGVPREIGLDGIAKGGSLLPHIVENENGIIDQVTLCTSISGGQEETSHMPNQISLTRYKWINGELHEFKENYKSDSFIRYLDVVYDEFTSFKTNSVIENAHDIFIEHFQNIPVEELLEKCDKHLSDLSINPNKFIIPVVQLNYTDTLFAEVLRRLKELNNLNNLNNLNK